MEDKRKLGLHGPCRSLNNHKILFLIMVHGASSELQHDIANHVGPIPV